MELEDRSNYIKIPKTNVLISRNESHKGLTWENAHCALVEDGLFMPPPCLFMKHFVNVIAAYEGKNKLLNGSYEPLTRSEIEEQYNKLISNSWVWLNAKFIKGTGYGGLNIEPHSSAVREVKIIAFTVSPLESCLMEDFFVDLKFNSQGLPTRKYEKQDYKRGKNLYFYYPRIDSVAGFAADSVRTTFSCGTDPQVSCVGQGVFACAEDTFKD